MTRKEIIVKVKLRLDELGPFEEGQVVDSGRIDHFLDDGVKRLLMIIPPYIPTPASFLDQTSTGGSVAFADNKSGYVPLPDDYLRLVSFKMDCWSRAVTSAISEFDPLYAKQGNEYLRGTHTKPVVVFRNDSDLGRILEYYSVTEGQHGAERGLYLASCVAEELEDDLVDPLSWLVAGQILSTVGEFDLAKTAEGKVVEWINGRTL